MALWEILEEFLKILSLTNTYLPHVGGVARSVELFKTEFEKLGHEVMIVAPEFSGQDPNEKNVIRLPALQNFNGSDFSVRLPFPGLLLTQLGEFKPDIVHAHHPFLLGETALRVAGLFDVPLVFTHHTMFENYTHYVPGDSPSLKRFVVDLSTSFANLADHVFSPSESVASVIRERGVETPVSVIPTGVDLEAFKKGSRTKVRDKLGIQPEDFVVGHLGRLSKEKNLIFLAQAIKRFLIKNKKSYFIVAGSGPDEEQIKKILDHRKVRDRVFFLGVVKGQEIVDFYHSIDVFAFSSFSETQGLVLTEAMAARIPVIAIDAPGAREVVDDGKNGLLLPTEDLHAFRQAIEVFARMSPSEMTRFKEAAFQTATEFSSEVCAKRAIKVYETLISETPPTDQAPSTNREMEHSSWEAILRCIETEWDIWAERVHLIGASIHKAYLEAIPIWGWIRRSWRWCLRWLNRSEWAIRLFDLSRSEGTAGEPGLILIQFDGLSKVEFEKAIQRRKLRFTKRILYREGYQLQSLYSGIPSTTPAFQGELFYGEKNAVVAFSFLDKEENKIVRMLDPLPSSKVQSRLGQLGQGLLEGGSSYSNIYTGGAKEAHYCAPVLGWREFFKTFNPLSFLGFLCFHFPSVIRVGWELIREFFVAGIDCLRGTLRGQDFWTELKFIPMRVTVCVFLRELVTVGACVDVARGLPIIHLNLLGYDEQAHRRGPHSAFAHRALQGMDRSVKKIWKQAHRSQRREYQVWIYSDHGQELVIPYSQLGEGSIEEAISKELNILKAENETSQKGLLHGIQSQRSLWLGRKAIKRILSHSDRGDYFREDSSIQLAALGPLGHFYTQEKLSSKEKQALAEGWVERLGIPLVFFVDEQNQSFAVNDQGCFDLKKDAARILGEKHPYLNSVRDDLHDLCLHENAGDLILSGWNPNGEPISFPLENGAHAGPGYRETEAFALLPAEIRFQETDLPLRALSLRRSALETLGRVRLASMEERSQQRSSTVRVMTYNVHSCIGTDGKLSPHRVARMIASVDADIIALQELDVGRPRSGSRDQAEELARMLEMEYHFHPAFEIEDEKYGICVLSKFPLTLRKSGPLPAKNQKTEPRGVLWVSAQVGEQEIEIFNTHFGLSPKERALQVDALLSADWLDHPDGRGLKIICGDFNAIPRSYVHQKLNARYRDAQEIPESHSPLPTWSSHHPVRRIDHIFVDKKIQITKAEVPRFRLARLASDHLPLIVEFNLQSIEGNAEYTN